MNGDVTSVSKTIAAGLRNLQGLRKLESADKWWDFSGCDSVGNQVLIVFCFFSLVRGLVNKNACENHRFSQQLFGEQLHAGED